MKKVIKRNQVIITSLAILIAVAGYLNFADVDLGFRDKEASADSSSILDQVDYDISDESALVEENSQNSLSDTADDTDTTTPGEAVLTGASGFAAQAKLSREQVRSQSKADLQEIINNADIDDEQKVHNVKFIGGCSGNTQGVAKLVEGMPAKEVIARLEGIQCGRRPTSCPDQLATALKEAIS